MTAIYALALTIFSRTFVGKFLRQALLYRHSVFGDEKRLKVAKTAILSNALFNTNSGSITIEDYVFFGHNVCVITGTHDPEKTLQERMDFPQTGNDIIIKKGAWIATHATVLGPCVIGENAVVAAGAVVTKDVSDNAVVGGVPAKFIKWTRE